MKIGVRLLRFFSRESEDQRMKFRRDVHEAEANCEYLQRLLKKVVNGHDKEVHGVPIPSRRD